MALQLTQKTAQQIMLVDRSYGRCCVHPEFFDAFYEKFMGSSPKINHLFRNTDLTAQKIALRTGIAHLISYAKGKSIANRKVQELGENHSRDRMDIDPDLYDIWVETLLETVAEFDPKFDEEAREAWLNVLYQGIELMKSLH